MKSFCAFKSCCTNSTVQGESRLQSKKQEPKKLTKINYEVIIRIDSKREEEEHKLPFMKESGIGTKEDENCDVTPDDDEDRPICTSGGCLQTEQDKNMKHFNIPLKPNGASQSTHVILSSKESKKDVLASLNKLSSSKLMEKHEQRSLLGNDQEKKKPERKHSELQSSIKEGNIKETAQMVVAAKPEREELERGESYSINNSFINYHINIPNNLDGFE